MGRRHQRFNKRLSLTETKRWGQRFLDMKLRVNTQLVGLLLLIALVASARAQLTPQQAIAQMTRGINLGRCLEMAYEGEANTIQEFYFEDIKNAGFNFVRVPIRWDQHTSATAPYTVDAAWLNRVQQVVDFGLKRGLIVIINSHHDRWILEDANYTAEEKARFDAIWAQVSDRLRTNSANLIFEIANEPLALSLSQVNQINASVIPIIRSNNPTRLIIYSGNGYTSVAQMKAATRPNDSYVMATFHSYDPWDFAGEGSGTWGTAADKQAVTNRFNDAAAWSQQYDIPVLLGEWGTVGWCDPASRADFIATYAQQAARTGIAPCVWHDFGWFGIYYPNNSPANRWSNVKDLIMANTQPAPVFNPPITITDISVQSNALNLAWTSAVGKIYAVEYSLDLLSWSNLVSEIPATAGTDTAVVLDLTSATTGTNDVLVQYQMGQLSPQIQDPLNTLAGGNLTKGSGINLFDPNSGIAYPTAPSLAVTFTVASTNLNAAMTNSAWFTLTLTVGANVLDLDLKNLTFTAARGGSGVPRGFAVTVTTPTTTEQPVQGDTQLTTQRTDWGPLQNVDLASFASLQNLTAGQTVTFKIPVYSPSTVSSLDFDNITVTGQSTFGSALANVGNQPVFFRVRQQ
jgi:aryl-phospho-beta-D-glucosidase BglC (GH1 family)